MPGMNSGINVNDPTVIAAFKAALVHQGIIALLIFGLLGLAWITVRAWRPAAAQAGGRRDRPARPRPPWPSPPGASCCGSASACCGSSTGSCRRSRRWRSGFRRRSSSPSAASSPHWVQQVVNWAGTTWSYHPMQAGAAAVWIQIGIGIWLLAAPRGGWSRLAGLVSVGWGLVVWVFGESFGGVFAPGLTWLFGAPGAVLIYCVAGALIALPERVWHDPRLGQAILAGLGLFLVAMAVLQAWPGRGFWQGISHGQPGTLAGMTHDMAQTPQPGFLSAWVRAFTSFDRGARVRGQPVRRGGARPDRCRLPDRPAAAGPPGADRVHGAVPGGLGADRGLRLLRRPGHRPQQHDPVRPAGRQRVPRPGPGTAARGGSRQPAQRPARRRPAAGWRDRVRPASLRRSVAAASFPTVVSLGALGLIILGAAPMAAAQASPNADPILAESIAGSSAPLNFPAKALPAHRPARPDGEPGQPARQGGAADLPGPGSARPTAR